MAQNYSSSEQFVQFLLLLLHPLPPHAPLLLSLSILLLVLTRKLKESHTWESVPLRSVCHFLSSLSNTANLDFLREKYEAKAKDVAQLAGNLPGI